jgi:hypothetical protein
MKLPVVDELSCYSVLRIRSISVNNVRRQNCTVAKAARCLLIHFSIYGLHRSGDENQLHEDSPFSNHPSMLI